MSRVKAPLDFLVYLAVRLLVCLVQAASLESCEAWSRRLAYIAWHALKLRRRVIEENLQIAMPELTPQQRSTVAIAMWRHLFLMIAEIAHAPRKLHRTNWRQHSTIPEMPVIVRRLLDPRPVIILSGHLGNFELGGYLLGLHGFPTYTIARRLDNPFLDRWVNKFRGATGQYMLDKAGSSGAIEDALGRGDALVLLGDQYAGDGACWVDFFGKPASTHKAVALFSLSASAPTATCGVLRRGGPMQVEMRVADLVDPREEGFPYDTTEKLIGWYSANLERLIRNAPDQYWWVHRRWKGNPRRRRPRRGSRRGAS